MPEPRSAYTHIEQKGRAGYVLTSDADAIAAAIFDGSGCVEDAALGRGQVSRFPLQSGEGILRRYRRGGLVGKVVADRFFFGNRMLREFDLLLALYQRGLPVPEPLGVGWERRGVSYRGQIATRRIAAVTLLDFLHGPGPHDDVLRCSGQLIAQMHDLGVWHADLQVKNILTDGTDVWLIDFDNARRLASLSTLARSRNLLRLRRSLEKHGRSLDNFQTIREGYGKLGLPRWLSGLYRIRGMVSDTLRK